MASQRTWKQDTRRRPLRPEPCTSKSNSPTSGGQVLCLSCMADLLRTNRAFLDATSCFLGLRLQESSAAAGTIHRPDHQLDSFGDGGPGGRAAIRVECVGHVGNELAFRGRTPDTMRRWAVLMNQTIQVAARHR